MPGMKCFFFFILLMTLRFFWREEKFHFLF